MLYTLLHNLPVIFYCCLRTFIFLLGAYLFFFCGKGSPARCRVLPTRLEVGSFFKRNKKKWIQSRPSLWKTNVVDSCCPGSQIHLTFRYSLLLWPSTCSNSAWTASHMCWGSMVRLAESLKVVHALQLIGAITLWFHPGHFGQSLCD